MSESTMVTHPRCEGTDSPGGSRRADIPDNLDACGASPDTAKILIGQPGLVDVARAGTGDYHRQWMRLHDGCNDRFEIATPCLPVASRCSC